MLIIASNPDRIPALMAIYSRMPERGKGEKLTVVELEDTSILDAVNCDGAYKNGLILISRGDEEGLAFAHECAHSIYERSFSHDERAAWGSFWKLHRKQMPKTGGARGEAEEGFAECYAYYYRSDSSRRKLNDSLQRKIAELMR